MSGRTSEFESNTPNSWPPEFVQLVIISYARIFCGKTLGLQEPQAKNPSPDDQGREQLPSNPNQHPDQLATEGASTRTLFIATACAGVVGQDEICEDGDEAANASISNSAEDDTILDESGNKTYQGTPRLPSSVPPTPSR